MRNSCLTDNPVATGKLLAERLHQYQLHHTDGPEQYLHCGKHNVLRSMLHLKAAEAFRVVLHLEAEVR